MKIGSLCSGYGGLDAAVREVLGGDLAWVADNNPGAVAILEHRFPAVPNLGDIAATTWSEVEPVDILAAGFPCQDVSCAGARRGLRKGNRTGVWTYVAEAIAALRPPLVLLENVRGLLTFGADSNLEPCAWCMGDSGDESVLRACGAVLADLADLGFDAEWALVSAAEVGAPHRRERVFILAWPAADTTSAGEGRRRIRRPAEPTAQPRESRRLLAEPDDGCLAAEDTDRAARGERRIAAPGETESGWPRADASGRGRTPAVDTSGEGLEIGTVEPDRDERQAAERGGGDAPADAEMRGRLDRVQHAVEQGSARSGIASEGNARGGDLDAANPERDRLEGSRAAAGTNERRSPTASVGRGSPDSDSVTGWGAYAPAIHRWEAILGRAAPRPTEPGRTGERLSPRFVEWMMGLPEGWVTDVPGLSRNAQLKALGNGVVPQQAATALRLLLDRAPIPSLVAASPSPSETEAVA